MEALRSQPLIADLTEAYRLLGERDVERAIREADAKQREGADPALCAALRWDCWMLLGDFERAWRECESIHGGGAQGSDCLWDGRTLRGRVLIRCLHGYGDAIQFLRYAPLLRASCERVLVETHPEMVELLRHLPGIDEVSSWKEHGPWDCQVEVMELPRIFRTTVDTIPRKVPYLTPGWRAFPRLTQHAGPKIGIIWGSGEFNPVRSIPARDLIPLIDQRPALFHNLQHGPRRHEITGIQDCDLQPDEILETARDLLELDLLITVDTMAAHLAGALGIPVWVMLPFEADWRWMLRRTDSPWYPTMRLFRQPHPESGWAPVIQDVIVRLRKKLLPGEFSAARPARSPNT